jgi:hypothetical protein
LEALHVAIIVLFAVVLIRGFLQRNLPRVGGKIGRRQKMNVPEPRPDGFSRIYARTMTIFTASAEAAASNASNFATLKEFLRRGTAQQPALMRIYRVAGCKTEIEIPAATPDYQCIDAAEALALLRELPDPRLVRRLHLSDERSFLDPWVRKVTAQDFFLLGNATSTGLVVLYKPDRRLERLIGLTLLHEWLHLVAFRSFRSVLRFKRANAIEPLAPLAVEPPSFGTHWTETYEAWCELGEKLFGYDEAIARDAAMAAPVHAMILWRRIDKLLRRTPVRLRSTRFAAYDARAVFMLASVAPLSRSAIERQPLWTRMSLLF